MADFTLTSDDDTFAGTDANDTVHGTEATLSLGDRLTGGVGYDTLLLSSGRAVSDIPVIYRVDLLPTFTGFENITVNTVTSDERVMLILGSQSVAVTAYGSGSYQVELGAGAITFQGGSGENLVGSRSASYWNAGNSIDGGGSGTIILGTLVSDDEVYDPYDLTTNTLSHINSLYVSGSNHVVKINSAVASGVANFYGFGTNDKLVTSDEALDLSHSTVHSLVYGFAVESTNATGTNFTVSDIGTAFQIAGGSGTDTLTAQGFTFSADQRSVIFGNSSVERIVDASGTYTAAPQNPNVFTLTNGSDTIAGTATNDTVYGTAATLNSGDSLTGGAGTDVLALTGNGTFRVDQLATFTGFEIIRLSSINYNADLYLGSQSVAVIADASASEQVYLGSGAVTCIGIDAVYSISASNWNTANSIDGGYIYLNHYGTENSLYDLTTNTLSNIHLL